MTPSADCQREDDCPRRATNSPPEWYEGCGAHNHAANDDHRKEEGKPKAFHNLWDLLEEIRTFNFLLRRAPCHIVGEQVREDSLTQGNAEPTEVEEKERYPGYVY